MNLEKTPLNSLVPGGKRRGYGMRKPSRGWSICLPPGHLLWNCAIPDFLHQVIHKSLPLVLIPKGEEIRTLGYDKLRQFVIGILQTCRNKPIKRFSCCHDNILLDEI